jgi:RNA 2',3'-cyclic 3'-phosphodiesterase
MRLFYAVELPPNVRQVAHRMQQQLVRQIGREGVRWEKPEKFHVTLKFLGETTPERLPALLEAGRHAASHTPTFLLSLHSLGAFPNQKQPKVVWLGCEPVAAMARLAASLKDSIEEEQERTAGSKPPPFQPHITLARIRTREGERACSKALQAEQVEWKRMLEPSTTEGGSQGDLIQDIVLMQSELVPGGSVYTVVERFPLESTLAFPTDDSAI